MVELRNIMMKWNRGKPREGILNLAGMMQLIQSHGETTLMFGNRDHTLVSIAREDETTLTISGMDEESRSFRKFRLPPVQDGEISSMYQPLWNLVQECIDQTITRFIIQNFSLPPGVQADPDDLRKVVGNHVNRTTTACREIRQMARDFQQNLLGMIDRDALEILTDITGAGVYDPGLGGRRGISPSTSPWAGTTPRPPWDPSSGTSGPTTPAPSPGP